jgi:acetyl-CoA decarbonylase/synthase, CODH/ACS complex subunit beta
MQREAIRELIDRLPETAGSFEGSEYTLPVAIAIEGRVDVPVQALKEKLLGLIGHDVKYQLEPLLVAAEIFESIQPDRQQFFLSDGELRNRVFTGSKWMAGWALVLGKHKSPTLVEELKRRSFMVFTDSPDLPDTFFIGSRPTSPVYFLQLMVRYGLIWGQIAPGNAHEMGHFIERDLPGLVFITEDLPPLKYLLALGLMKLGAPAVVPSSFPYPYGRRVVADSVDQMLELGNQFENLRRRYYQDEIIALPAFCDPAFAQERFAVAQRRGGTENSFFCARPSTTPIGPTWRVIGEESTDIAVLIDLAEDRMTDDVALTIERDAIHAIRFFEGIRGYEKHGRLVIELAEGVTPDYEQIAEAIFWQVRLHYPRIKKMSVTLIADPAECRRLAPEMAKYKEKRRVIVESMNEENTEEFVACTECRPFSLVHTCIVTPDRTPMCSARSYASIKAAALFGNCGDPFKRRSDEALDLRAVFHKGATIDQMRGEYEGANAAYRTLTNGKLERVFLHSVRQFPHTSCGCFQALAFWIDEVQGLGVMGRGSNATAPNGATWDQLANSAGGKQTPGIMGVSVAYLCSRHFLAGDGGISNLVWSDSELLAKIKNVIPPDRKVATEKEATTMAQLRAFLGRGTQ